MLGSDYRELIVPRNDNKGKAAAILFGGGLLTVLSVLLALLTGHYLLLILTLALGFGTFWFFRNEQVEYEYIISGDELRITKIISQSSRKEMLVVSINQFTAFDNLRNAPAPAESQTLVLACTAEDTSAFYADFDHPEHGQTRLIFTPNDDILDYLAKHIRRGHGFSFRRPDSEN